MKFEKLRAWLGENKIRTAAVILAALLLLLFLVGLLLVNVLIGRIGYEAEDTEPVTIDPAYAAGNGIYFPEIEAIRKPGVINVLFLGTDFAIGEEGSRGRADSNMLCSLDTRSGAIRLVSFERGIGVPVPAGVDSGTRIRLAHEGEVGECGGEAGDLYVDIRVRKDERFSREVDEQVPGTYDKVLKLLKLCDTVFNSVNVLSITPMSKPRMLLEHEAFVKTAGYSTKEVLDTFDLPQKALDLLAPYWIYVGSGFSDLPFTIYSVLMADYVGYGSMIPKKLSHEMSLKMAERAEEMGVQIEYRQHVDKILVKNGKAYGVRTARGDEIHADYVISSAYPNKVYTSMIEPLSEVPEEATKMVNGRRLSLTAFSVILILDKPAEELNIRDYSIFYGDTMNTDVLYENLAGLGPYRYLTCICHNYGNPGVTPEGTCSFSVTVLPRVDGWKTVRAEDYDRVKHEVAKQVIDDMSEYFGVNLLDHVLEAVIETPMTIAHYTGAWNGLEFSGAHAISGDGMGPAVTNGRKAAKNVLDDIARKEAQG